MTVEGSEMYYLANAFCLWPVPACPYLAHLNTVKEEANQSFHYTKMRLISYVQMSDEYFTVGSASCGNFMPSF